MTVGYAESYRRLGKLGRYGVPSFRADWAENCRERQRFSKFLDRLKQEGLVENKGKPRHAIWHLTVKGVARLARFRTERPHPSPRYQNSRDGKWRVVIYDVPEREREKRVWIRRALLSLGFEFLQGSVWVGTCAIPKAFLDDLREMEMLSYVQIFEITRCGSIALVR